MSHRLHPLYQMTLPSNGEIYKTATVQ